MRILIVGNNSVPCQSFRDHLPGAETKIVDAVGAGEETFLYLHYSDVVLVSSALPEALALVQEISTNYPELSVLVTGVEEETERILQYAEAGANGYLVRDEAVETMVQKIEASVRGEALVSPQVAASLMMRLASLSRNTQARSRYLSTQVECEDLTPRQSEVLELLREDLSNREIANRLYIQVGTVKNHVHHILRKLDVHDRYEAVAAYGRWLQREGAREAYVLP